MHYYTRIQKEVIVKYLKQFPALILLGPRQVGKSTLAKKIASDMSDQAIYLDLERSKDRAFLKDPEAFWQLHKNKLIILDEIQMQPDFFHEMRSFIDENPNKMGQFLLLGSASRDLMHFSSQSLAGRAQYIEIYPFSLPEIPSNASDMVWQEHWLRGGMPKSILNLKNEIKEFERFFLEDELSLEWRKAYIQSFLYRDLPSLGFKASVKFIERLWHMLAHVQGQLLNASNLGKALGVGYHRVKDHLDWLEGTFIVRLLPAYYSNLKKRLIKSPKVYVRDSGLLHALLGIVNHNDLLIHPVRGHSFEGYVIEQILQNLPLGCKAYFYRTSNGQEIDLLLEKAGKKYAFEIKVASVPKLRKSFFKACKDLDVTEKYAIAPVEKAYITEHNTKVLNVREAIQAVKLL